MIEHYLRNGVTFEDICREDPPAAARFMKNLQSRLDAAESRITWFVAQLDTEVRHSKELQHRLEACKKALDLAIARQMQLGQLLYDKAGIDPVRVEESVVQTSAPVKITNATMRCNICGKTDNWTCGRSDCPSIPYRVGGRTK